MHVFTTTLIAGFYTSTTPCMLYSH